jgi:hypothetical protein
VERDARGCLPRPGTVGAAGAGAVDGGGAMCSLERTVARRRAGGGWGRHRRDRESHPALRCRRTTVATGILPVGDAWACTNPSFGRGLSIGLAQVIILRRSTRYLAPIAADCSRLPVSPQPVMRATSRSPLPVIEPGHQKLGPPLLAGARSTLTRPAWRRIPHVRDVRERRRNPPTWPEGDGAAVRTGRLGWCRWARALVTSGRSHPRALRQPWRVLRRTFRRPMACG